MRKLTRLFTMTATVLTGLSVVLANGQLYGHARMGDGSAQAAAEAPATPLPPRAWLPMVRRDASPAAAPTTTPTPTPSPTPCVAPNLVFTFVPAMGSAEYLQGRVDCVDPSMHKVAVYVFVQGWYTKPYYDAPSTVIRADGTWTANIVTGGADACATKIAAFVLPNSVETPIIGGGQALPPSLGSDAVAQTIIERPFTRTITFAGRAWRVKACAQPLGPGPNRFSDRPEDVWVDAQGRLHLRLSQQNGVWRSAEVISTEPFSYGTYTFTLASRVDQLDPNAVLGLFTWEDATPQHNYREMDIEFSRWGVPSDSNAQFVVQPWNRAGNRHRFNIALLGDRSTHAFSWRGDAIAFGSYQDGDAAPANLIETWTYTGPDVPPAGNGNVRINLWLLNGWAPTDGQPEEVIIESFTFTPLQ